MTSAKSTHCLVFLSEDHKRQTRCDVSSIIVGIRKMYLGARIWKHRYGEAKISIHLRRRFPLWLKSYL